MQDYLDKFCKTSLFIPLQRTITSNVPFASIMVADRCFSSFDFLLV